MTGVERARTELEGGDARLARERLRSWLVEYPHDREARRLLAVAYRDDGQPTEAGRWGYLVGPDATERERRAFERHCAYGDSTRITEARLRHLLRCPDLAAIADDGRALLASLPTTTRPDRLDGRWDRLSRRWAVGRARRRYAGSGR